MAEVQTQQKTEKKSDIKLDLQKNAFPKLIETAFADTHSFSQMINSVFSEAFKPQYYGSKIDFINNRVDSTLYFTDRGARDDEYDDENGPYKAIEPIGTKGEGVVAQLKAYNNFHSMAGGYRPKFYKLTNTCKSILSEFIPRYAMDSKGNIKWDKGDLVTEHSMSDGYGSSRVLIGVKIDFVRLIKKVYGSEYDYSVIMGQPVNTNVQMFAGGASAIRNWQMFIIRASKEDIKNLATQYGYSAYNKMGIVTE